jgi:phage host-nuclease inhibitor protein Gam
MSAIDQISKRAEVYAQVRALLAEKVTALNDGIAQLQRDHIPGIKKAVAKAAEAQASLQALIEAHPECFTKPKTQVLSGVKVGFQKGKGTISFDDADTVVARIKKHLPDQVDLLIRNKETPVKEALAQLSAADLKKIGVSVTEAGEQVVIKPVDSEVDKLVEAMLKSAGDEA